jgi:hypothetical protein
MSIRFMPSVSGNRQVEMLGTMWKHGALASAPNEAGPLGVSGVLILTSSSISALTGQTEY